MRRRARGPSAWPFTNGIGASFTATSILATILGHYLAAVLPDSLVAALLFLAYPVVTHTPNM